MKFILFIVFFSTLQYLSFGQKKYLKYPIYFDIKKQFIQVIDISDSSVITNLGTDSSKFIKVFNFSQHGNLNFIILDDKMNVRVEGHYLESVKLLKKKILGRGLGRSKAPVIRTLTYYKPIRKGVWKYYNELGEIVLIENY